MKNSADIFEGFHKTFKEAGFSIATNSNRNNRIF